MSKKKSKYLRPIIATAVFIMTIAVYFNITKKTAHVARATRGDATDTVAANFTVREKHLSRITVRDRHETIEEVFVEIGDKVKKGDVLIQLRDSGHKHELEEDKLDEKNTLELMALKSDLEFRHEELSEELEFAQKQFEKGLVSEKNIIDLKLAVDETYANVRREDLANQMTLVKYRNLIQKRHIDIRNATIRSPKDAVVYDVFKRESEVALPWSPVIDLIYDEKSVVADVSEKDIKRIKVGDSCLLKFLAYKNETFPGKITYILPKQDLLTKTIDVYIEAEVPKEKLVPGLNGEVSFRLDFRKNALLIPNQALMKDIVLVVRNGRVTHQKVKTGFKGLTNTEILEGLKENDLVITRELSRFKDGMFVKTKIR